MEIIDDYKVVFHLTQAAPEFVENISANTDLVMESKALGCRGQGVVRAEGRGHGPFEFVERKWARTSSTNGSKTTGARSRSTKN